jgi:cell wall-associated NlpC family hydrolase
MNFSVVVAGFAGSLCLVGLAVSAGTEASSVSLSAASSQVSPSTVARIPADVLADYARAAAACPGLSWTVLAAVGTVESGNGTSTLPGVHGGSNPAGAEGPMQFEPATFAEYSLPVPPGGAEPPTPYDMVDATFAAARMLCADGAGDPATLGQALFDYNHSASYVARVLSVAASYGMGTGSWTPGGAGSAASLALRYALAQVGTPYVWGGETAGVGFDCSGLVQAAWASAGVALPRVAAAQMAAGPVVPPESPLAPGDLVFFGPAPANVTHVGMVVDPQGMMVDAPHTGAWVRVEQFPTAVGSWWGGDIYLGATRPGAGGVSVVAGG